MNPKLPYVYVCLLALPAMALGSGSAVSSSVQRQFAANQAECFIENQGQWDSQAMFLAQSQGVDSWVTQDGVVYDFHRFVPSADQKRGLLRTHNQPMSGTRFGQVVKMTFTGSRPTQVTPVNELSGRLNYFLGNDRSKWAAHVRRFGEARAEQIYDGISARYYFDDGVPRYDLVVAPGADPSRIRMRFEGAESLEALPSGALQIGTSLGPIEERGLFVYQKSGLDTKQVKCKIATDGRTVWFEVGSYDPAKPLVIDPLVSSAYLGGSDGDTCNALALDRAGNAVVAGHSYSTDFPITIGAYEKTNKSGSTGFVAKLSSDGKTLIFGTYLGGGYYGSCQTVALDSAGNVVVAGKTNSSDFPVTPGAYQSKNKTTYYGTGFVAKLNSTGSSLIFGTYLGGTDDDICLASALDSGANVVVAGYTSSKDFPVTPGTFQSKNKGSQNGFIAKLSSDGKSLSFSTYLGGRGGSGGYDACNALALDSAANVVVTGYTYSIDFPVTPGAYQSINKSVYYNTGFVAKLSSDGKSMIFGTYLGGTNGDTALALALDSARNVVVAGETYSTDFPVTAGTFQTKMKNRSFSGFIDKLSSDGKSLIFGTYFGGSGANGGDSCDALALDPAGNIAVAGYTYSTDFPVSSGAFQKSNLNTYYRTGYVATLSSNGKTSSFASYLGGSGNVNGGDSCNALALNSARSIVVAGYTYSPNFPVTAGSYQTKNKSKWGNGFVSKVSLTFGLNSLRLAAPVITGGVNEWGIVGMDGGTSTGNTAVALSSSKPLIASVPTSVVVPAGKFLASFLVATYGVDVATPAIITASYAGVSKTAALTINPAGLSKIVISPASVKGGTSSVGTLYLTGQAGPSGIVVKLTSDKAAATVPASIKVLGGQTMATFPVTTSHVTTATTATITASYGAQAKQASLTINR